MSELDPSHYSVCQFLFTKIIALKFGTLCPPVQFPHGSASPIAWCRPPRQPLTGAPVLNTKHPVSNPLPLSRLRRRAVADSPPPLLC